MPGAWAATGRRIGAASVSRVKAMNTRQRAVAKRRTGEGLLGERPYQSTPRQLQLLRAVTAHEATEGESLASAGVSLRHSSIA